MDYYQSPRWTNELYDCSMPMTFDTYSNCSYKCLYCFSQYQRGVGKCKTNYTANKVKPVNIKKIKQIFLHPESNQFGTYIKNKKVMQWGGLSDQFDENEKKYGVTLELLKFFREIEYPLCFSTKAVWWLDDVRYTELFKNNKIWNIKISIITMDEGKSRKIEIGCPTPNQRLLAIEKISKLNCGGATLRLRPFIIGMSDPSHVDLIKKAGNFGATALSTEFFCLEQRSPILKTKLHVFNDVCGFDIIKFYKKYSNANGYLRLCRNIKRKYVDEMENACKEVGMRFYVSDAHFKERCANGSCCGLGENWNYSRGSFCEALVLAKKNKSVKFSDITHDMEHFNFELVKASGFNMNSTSNRAKLAGMSVIDYLRYLWNSPNSGRSPYKMFDGILYPSGKDNNGDIIYVLREEKL